MFEVWSDFECVLRTDDEAEARARYAAHVAQANAEKMGDIVVLREVSDVTLEKHEAEADWTGVPEYTEPLNLAALLPKVTAVRGGITYGSAR